MEPVFVVVSWGYLRRAVQSGSVSEYNDGMQQTSIGIRRAQPVDAAQMVAISPGSATGPVAPLVMDRWFEMSGVFSYVAEEEMLFGHVIVGPSTIEAHDNRQGQVLAWAIHSAYRHRGIGRKLLVHGMSVLKRRMFERVDIWLPEVAQRAQDIVSRLGFEASGTERLDNELRDGRVVRSLNYLCYGRDLDDFF